MGKVTTKLQIKKELLSLWD